MIPEGSATSPMPSAKDATDVIVKPGDFSNWRKAKRREFMRLKMTNDE